MDFIRKHLKKIIIFLLLVSLIVLFKATSYIIHDPGVAKWLNSPVSEMKIWHLLLVLWIIGLFTSHTSTK